MKLCRVMNKNNSFTVVDFQYRDRIETTDTFSYPCLIRTAGTSGANTSSASTSFFRLDDGRAFDLLDLHKISSLQTRDITDVLRGGNLPALAEFTDGHGSPTPYCA
jgi:hypothetical protein